MTLIRIIFFFVFSFSYVFASHFRHGHPDGKEADEGKPSNPRQQFFKFFNVQNAEEKDELVKNVIHCLLFHHLKKSKFEKRGTPFHKTPLSIWPTCMFLCVHMYI